MFTVLGGPKMGRSNSKSSNARSRRVTPVNATRSVHWSFAEALNDLATSPTSTPKIAQDLRRFHFLGDFRPLETPTGRQHRLQVKNVNLKTRTKFVHLPSRVQFANAKSLTYCARRKIRRAVIHALGFSGRRGRGAYRKPTYSWYSRVSC